MPWRDETGPRGKGPFTGQRGGNPPPGRGMGYMMERKKGYIPPPNREGGITLPRTPSAGPLPSRGSYRRRASGYKVSGLFSKKNRGFNQVPRRRFFRLINKWKKRDALFKAGRRRGF